MAISPKNLYPSRVIDGDAEYPYGKALNLQNGIQGTGTPLEEKWVNDQWGFHQALLAEAGIVPNGSPDKVGGSQYLDAIKLLGKKAGKESEEVIKAILVAQGYTGDYGFFSDGFTYVNEGDVGITADNTIWIYVGTGAPNKVVSAGTVPSIGAGYEQVVFNVTETSVDTAYLSTGVIGVGETVNISDRASYNFKVVSGGTPNGLDIIDAGFGRTAELVSDGLVNIEALGVVEFGDATDAINRLTELGLAALIPSRRYTYTKTDNRFANPTIVGAKRPSYNENKTALVGGSILEGTLQLKGANPTILNVGIDHGKLAFPSSPENALVLAHENPFTKQSIATVLNVIALCADVEDPFHAMLVEGHHDTNIDNVVGIKSFFGAALKNTRNNVNNAIFIDNGSDNLIVKSDTTSGKAESVNLSNIICKGAGTVAPETTSFNVRLSAFDNDISDVNINNVVGDGAAYVVYLDASGDSAGKMDGVNINNVISSESGRGVLIDGGSGTGMIDKVKITNTTFKKVDFRAFEAKGNVGMVDVDNWYSSNVSDSPNIIDSFNVISASAVMSISNTKLLVDNNESNLATVNLVNSYEKNQLSGNNKFNLNGAGIPKRGFSINSDTGAAIQIQQTYDSNNSSFIEMNAAGTRVVTSINRQLPGGSRYPTGYMLTILNNASGNVTMKHNPAGSVYNRGLNNVVIKPSEVVSYIFGGAVWHQTNTITTGFSGDFTEHTGKTVSVVNGVIVTVI